MKKMIAVLLAVLFLCAAGCRKAAVDDQPAKAADGAWTTPDSPVVTPQLQEVVRKGFASFTGAVYEPVALLASQIVSGTNYRFLCKTDSVLPDGTQTFSIVELYADLSGNVRITDIVDSVVPTRYHAGENLSGGWSQPDSPEVTDELRQALKSTGTGNEPVACVGTQVVAGMNYCVLCTVPDEDNAYMFAYLYVDLQGNAQLTDAVRFTEGSDNENR